MKSIISSALMLVIPALFAISSDAAAETLVEASPEVVPPGILGTVAYLPTTLEEPYYKRLDKEQRLTVKTTDDSAFKDVNGDGVVDEVGTIGFSTSAGDAEVLHIPPVTRDQIPALNIVLKRDGQGRTLWSWKLAETGEPGVYSIELGPLGAAIPKARYTWSKAESRYIGPDGGGNLPFMRLNAATPLGLKEFDAFVREKESN